MHEDMIPASVPSQLSSNNMMRGSQPASNSVIRGSQATQPPTSAAAALASEGLRSGAHKRRLNTSGELQDLEEHWDDDAPRGG